MDQKLNKKEILRRPKEYKKVYKAGRETEERGLTLKAYPNSLGFSRLGITIPKRIVSKAAVRNKLKRYLREAYRQNKHWIKGGFDLVVTFRCNTFPADGFYQIEEKMLSLLGKQGLLTGKEKQPERET